MASTPTSPPPGKARRTIVVATTDFDGGTKEDALTFKEGDRITVLWKPKDARWWRGRLASGREGMFRRDHVRRLRRKRVKGAKAGGKRRTGATIAAAAHAAPITHPLAGPSPPKEWATADHEDDDVDNGSMDDGDVAHMSWPSDEAPKWHSSQDHPEDGEVRVGAYYDRDEDTEEDGDYDDEEQSSADDDDYEGAGEMVAAAVAAAKAWNGGKSVTSLEPVKPAVPRHLHAVTGSETDTEDMSMDEAQMLAVSATGIDLQFLRQLAGDDTDDVNSTTSQDSSGGADEGTVMVSGADEGKGTEQPKAKVAAEGSNRAGANATVIHMPTGPVVEWHIEDVSRALAALRVKDADVEALREEEIDGRALLVLTDADLRELGLKLGSRRKIEAFVASLKAQGCKALDGVTQPMTSRSKRDSAAITAAAAADACMEQQVVSQANQGDDDGVEDVDDVGDGGGGGGRASPRTSPHPMLPPLPPSRVTPTHVTTSSTSPRRPLPQPRSPVAMVSPRRRLPMKPDAMVTAQPRPVPSPRRPVPPPRPPNFHSSGATVEAPSQSAEVEDSDSSDSESSEAPVLDLNELRHLAQQHVQQGSDPRVLQLQPVNASRDANTDHDPANATINGSGSGSGGGGGSHTKKQKKQKGGATIRLRPGQSLVLADGNAVKVDHFAGLKLAQRPSSANLYRASELHLTQSQLQAVLQKVAHGDMSVEEALGTVLREDRAVTLSTMGGSLPLRQSASDVAGPDAGVDGASPSKSNRPGSRLLSALRGRSSSAVLPVSTLSGSSDPEAGTTPKLSKKGRKKELKRAERDSKRKAKRLSRKEEETPPQSLSESPRLQPEVAEDLHKFALEGFADEFFATVKARKGFARKRVPVLELLSYNAKPLEKPVLRLPDEQWEKAVGFSHIILKYMHASDDVDVLTRVEMVHPVLRACMQEANFRDEFFAQLCRQVNGCPSESLTMRAWQLMAIASAFVVPSSDFAPYLDRFFTSYETDRLSPGLDTSVRAYALWCSRQLGYRVGEVSRRMVTSPELVTAATAAVTHSSFGESLDYIMEEQKSRFPDLDIPWIMQTLMDLVRTTGTGMQTEGLFRISVSQEQLTELRQELDRRATSIVCATSHVPACILKHWMISLPTTLVPASMYDEAIRIAQQCGRSDYDIATTQAFVQRLPKHHGAALTALIRFARELLPHKAHTRMDVPNLAIVYAPGTLRCQDANLALQNSMHECGFVAHLIEDLPLDKDDAEDAESQARPYPQPAHPMPASRPMKRPLPVPASPREGAEAGCGNGFGRGRCRGRGGGGGRGRGRGGLLSPRRLPQPPSLMTAAASRSGDGVGRGRARGGVGAKGPRPRPNLPLPPGSMG